MRLCLLPTIGIRRWACNMVGGEQRVLNRRQEKLIIAPTSEIY